MIRFKENITAKLNDLLEHTYDAERAYKLGQDEVENPTIKRFMGDKVQQRYNFGHQLRTEIMEYGHLRNNNLSFIGDLHRTWIKLTMMLDREQSKIILDEVERSENQSLKMYNVLLHDESLFLPESTKKLLRKQRNSIRAALNIAIDKKEMIA